MENTGITNIQQLDSRTLEITWADKKVSKLDVVDLRKRCPCAVCVDEWTREKLLKPDQIKDSVRPLRIDSVGRYALSIKFNDGHGTGIYTFKMLRDLH